jgi:2-carboxy-1,4-naphthoquinone phytyltransferase
MTEPKVVASRYANSVDRSRLWQAAIKWPMYAVAVMPVLLAAGWRLGQALPVRFDQLLLFLLAAVLLLAWENLANDVFDADTGVDADGKPHSVVNLTGRRDRVAGLANGCLLLGLALMALVAWRSSPAVLALVLACCGLGYLYQGPPFRLGYRGLGEPLCWLAFGPAGCPGASPWPLAVARPSPPPWCCSAPISIRLMGTPPMASVRRWCIWVRRLPRGWCPGLWPAAWPCNGRRCCWASGRSRPCSA